MGQIDDTGNTGPTPHHKSTSWQALFPECPAGDQQQRQWCAFLLPCSSRPAQALFSRAEETPAVPLSDEHKPKSAVPCHVGSRALSFLQFGNGSTYGDSIGRVSIGEDLLSINQVSRILFISEIFFNGEQASRAGSTALGVVAVCDNFIDSLYDVGKLDYLEKRFYRL